MGKEALRHRERRAVHAALRDGTVHRRPPTSHELAELIAGIDHRNINLFGVRRIAGLELDALHPIPTTHMRPCMNNVGFERRVTLLSYAAWRRRHDVVKHLLVAGASPTLSDRAPTGSLGSDTDEKALSDLLSRRSGHGLASAAATYAVECVARMRCFAARDAALDPASSSRPCGACGVRGRTLSFDACGCACCEGCVWRTLLSVHHTGGCDGGDGGGGGGGGGGGDGGGGDGDEDYDDDDGGDAGEVTCPCCGSRPPLRGCEDPAAAIAWAARGEALPDGKGGDGKGRACIGRDGPGRQPLADWTCECCAYTNFGSRPVCRNCAAPRVLASCSRPPLPPSLCADLPRALAEWGRRQASAAAAWEASKAVAKAKATTGMAAVRQIEATAEEGGTGMPGEAGVPGREAAAAPDTETGWSETGLSAHQEVGVRPTTAAPIATSAVSATAADAAGATVTMGSLALDAASLAKEAKRAAPLASAEAHDTVAHDTVAHDTMAHDTVANAAGANAWVEVEMSVHRRRALGKQLCFLMGASGLVRVRPAKGGGEGGRQGGGGDQGRLPSPLPTEIQLVLDLRALGGEAAAACGEAAAADGEAAAIAVEAHLAISQASRGERVRAVGPLRMEIDSDGRPRWEVLAHSVLLLRPCVIPEVARAEAAEAGSMPRQAAGERGGESGGEGGGGGGSAKAQLRNLRSAPPREAALAQMRLLRDDQQRREAAAAAAAEGDSIRLEALLSLGLDVEPALDEYGQTAVYLAASHGHLPLLRRLLRHGASPDTPAHGGSTPACAAAARGHHAALAMLADAGADLSASGALGLSPADFVFRRALASQATPSPPSLQLLHAAAAASAAAAAAGKAEAVAAARTLPGGASTGARVVRLIDSNARHAGAGACYIDGGVPESVCLALDRLFASLPMAERQRCSQGLNDRSYYCDAEGWVVEALREAVGLAYRAPSAEHPSPPPPPCEGEAMAQMRYLVYAEVGGGLPPHVDLSRTRRDGRTSRCTFILYLTDCERGGETVLLQRLAQPARILASVTPRRGRLLIFPHLCPHRANEVVAEGLPKLLLRGEML